MSSSSPEAKPAQPKDAQDSSGAKDLVASDGEQEKKQPVNDGATPKVEASAPPVTKSQAAPAPVSSEKPPLPPSDSTPAPSTSPDRPDPEKAQDSTVPITTAGVPAEPGSRELDALERRRKRRELIIHTRLARFFSWILLLGFVILPSTLTKGEASGGSSGGNCDNQPSSSGSGSGGTESELVDEAKNTIEHVGLFVIGYVCCLINGFAIGWLWYLRKDDYEWLFTNLFTAGLINAFSGLITTLVSVFGVQKGKIGSSSTSTLTLSSFCTFVYAVLTAVYFRKRLQARYRRGSRASSAMV